MNSFQKFHFAFVAFLGVILGGPLAFFIHKGGAYLREASQAGKGFTPGVEGTGLPLFAVDLKNGDKYVLVDPSIVTDKKITGSQGGYYVYKNTGQFAHWAHTELNYLVDGEEVNSKIIDRIPEGIRLRRSLRTDRTVEWNDVAGVSQFVKSDAGKRRYTIRFSERGGQTMIGDVEGHRMVGLPWDKSRGYVLPGLREEWHVEGNRISINLSEVARVDVSRPGIHPDNFHAREMEYFRRKKDYYDFVIWGSVVFLSVMAFVSLLVLVKFKMFGRRSDTLFKFECTACGQRISATADLCGSTAACPNCATSFVVPSFPHDVQPLSPLAPHRPHSTAVAGKDPFRSDAPQGAASTGTSGCWFCKCLPPFPSLPQYAHNVVLERSENMVNRVKSLTVTLGIPRCAACAARHAERRTRIKRAATRATHRIALLPAVAWFLFGVYRLGIAVGHGHFSLIGLPAAIIFPSDVPGIFHATHDFNDVASWVGIFPLLSAGAWLVAYKLIAGGYNGSPEMFPDSPHTRPVREVEQHPHLVPYLEKGFRNTFFGNDYM